MKYLNLVKSYRYELVAMITGACVLILEIVGARVIAPYFGTSTYVWTAMIGVILGALSVGYWVGGRAADKDRPKQDIPLILTFAGFLVALMTLLNQPILEFISKGNFDLRISALLAALVLFSAPSALIGMISPHLAKIRLQSLKNSGETIGRLEAAGALGSIIGVFLSGYFLLSYFGSKEISFFIAIILIATSFIVNKDRVRLLRLFLIAVIVFFLFNPPGVAENLILDKNTAYARYQVEKSNKNGKQVIYLKTDNSAVQSGFFPDYPNEPALDYAATTIGLIENNFESLKSVLVIGGGAHTLPMLLSNRYPESVITAVEIDRELDKIAMDYFGYKENDKINIVYEDARTYLNKNTDKFELIIVDAYSSSTIPFHLATYQAVEKMNNSLSDNGLLIANVISKKQKGFLPSAVSTYNEFFSTKVIAVHPNLDLSKDNYLILATKNTDKKLDYRPESQVYPENGKVLYDNFAPVEKLSY